MEQTDVKFGAGAVIQLVSLVLKSLLMLFTTHQKGVLPSQQPSWQFIYCFLNKTAVQISEEFNRLGEWYEMFQSWQLPFTA